MPGGARTARLWHSLSFCRCFCGNRAAGAMAEGDGVRPLNSTGVVTRTRVCARRCRVYCKVVLSAAKASHADRQRFAAAASFSRAASGLQNLVGGME